MKPSIPTAADGATRIDWLAGNMHGSPLQSSEKKLGQLEGVFRDSGAWQLMSPDTLVYRVQWHEAIPQGMEGGLFWGTTTIEPGRIGDEYFMTRGHFHARRDRGEYYSTVQGRGMLLLMDEERVTRVEAMEPGSLHYIPGYIAHRTVNTGDTPLIFWACWPSDSGHDYETIARQGFSARVLDRDGSPAVVPEER
jgi:glucose-6-phosphate isomerase, archaeal